MYRTLNPAFTKHIGNNMTTPSEQQQNELFEVTTNKDLNGVMNIYTGIVVAFLGLIVSLVIAGSVITNQRISDTNASIISLTQEMRADRIEQTRKFDSLNIEQNRRFDNMNIEQSRKFNRLADIIYNISERVAVVEARAK